MKQKLQIVGAEMVGNEIVKLKCIPYTTEKVKIKKPSLMEIATGGASLQDLVSQTEETKTRLTVFYVSNETWVKEFKNKLYTSINVDVAVETFLDERMVKEKYGE